MDQQNQTQQTTVNTKFCKHCGAKIPSDAVLCTACGRQVEEIKGAHEQPSIVINNANSNVNSNINQNGMSRSRERNTWVAFFLCVFLGYIGAHKFYEGKTGMGILYLFTFGFFGIGWFIDCFALLFKPTPYYV